MADDLVAEDAVFDHGQDEADQADDEEPKSPVDRHHHARGQNRAHDNPNQNDQENIHAGASLTIRHAQASTDMEFVLPPWP